MTQRLPFGEGIDLLHDEESDDGVRAEAKEVRGEALPESEETFVFDDFEKNVDGALVFIVFHVLKSGFGNIDGNGDDSGDEARDEGGNEVGRRSFSHQIGRN